MSKLVTDLRIDALAGSLPEIVRHDFTRAADRIAALEAALQKLLRFSMLEGGFHSDVPEIDTALTLLKDYESETEGKLVVSPTVKRIAEEAGYTDLIENKLIPETSAEPNVCPTCRGRGANTVDKASGKTVYYCNCETVVKRAASTQGHMHAEWAPQSDCLCEACVEYFQSDRASKP